MKGGDDGFDFPLQQELQREIDQEIESMLAAARRDGEAIAAAAGRRSEEQEAAGRQRLERDLVERRRRALARADLAARNAILRLKQEETNRVFALLRENLSRMEKEEPEAWLDLLLHIFRTCRQLLPPGPVRARVGVEAAALQEKLAREGEVETIFDADLEGVILESIDGRLHCDGSLEGLLDRLRQTREAEVEEILFREG